MDPKIIGFGMILAGNLVNGTADIIKTINKNKKEKEESENTKKED